ncbi:MAG: hypothetical protein NZM04_02480 [Methylacidiphilales bacterium]|nr:hypothetical protein [Candidatus Methylacidiphilales bacterium]
MVEDRELTELMRACAQDSSQGELRDAAMIAIAAKTGAQREEIVHIRIAIVDLRKGSAEIRIICKGNVDHVLYLDGSSLCRQNK